MITTLSRQRLQQLAQEATALADWMMVKDFARQMWGDKAVKVEISTYGEYNDEGGTNYYIEAITAYDTDGNELEEYDHSLPFFASKAWKHSEETYKDDYDSDFQRLKDFYMPIEEQRRGAWILIEDLPVDRHNGGSETYDLTAPPSLTLPIEGAA